MPYKPSVRKGLRDSIPKAKIRVLLALWDLGASENSAKKSELIKWVKNSKERTKDYDPVLDKLETNGAIAIANNQISLTDRGLTMLDESLTSSQLALGDNEIGSFEFPGSIIGTKVANALLKWIRDRATGPTVQSSTATTATPQPTKSPVETRYIASPAKPQPAIASYEQFSQVVLEVYQQLNRDYNYEHLVPIYHLRREMGDRLTRSQFTDWLIEMQVDDIFQLMTGEILDMTQDKREDSLIIPDVGLRYYAKRIDREEN